MVVGWLLLARGVVSVVVLMGVMGNKGVANPGNLNPGNSSTTNVRVFAAFMI